MVKTELVKHCSCSNILHSLIEIKRGKYTQIKEVSENNYYRVGSLKYVNSEEVTTYNRIEFGDEASYTEVMTRNYQIFSQNYTADKYPNVNAKDSKLKESGFYNIAVSPKNNPFEEEVFLFFPVERYYILTWENKNNDSLTYITILSSFVIY